MEGQPQNNQGHKQASQSSEQMKLQGLPNRPNINNNQEKTRYIQESPIPPPSQNIQNDNQANLNQSCHPLLDRPAPAQQIHEKQKIYVASNSYEGSSKEQKSKQNQNKSDNKEKDCWEKICGLFLNCFSSGEQKSLSPQEKEQEKVSEAIRGLKQQQYQYIQNHQEECLIECRRIIETAQRKNTSIILDRAAEYFYQVAKYYYYSEQYYEAQQQMNRLIAKRQTIQKANFSQTNLKLFQLLIDSRQRVQQFRLKQPEITDLKQKVKNRRKKIANNLITLSHLLDPQTNIQQVKNFQQKFKLKVLFDEMIENKQNKQKMQQFLEKLKQIKKQLNKIECGQLLPKLIPETIECASTILKYQPQLQQLSKNMNGDRDEIQLSFQQFTQSIDLSDSNHKEQILLFSKRFRDQIQKQNDSITHSLNQALNIQKQSSTQNLFEQQNNKEKGLKNINDLKQGPSKYSIRCTQIKNPPIKKSLNKQLLTLKVNSSGKSLTFSTSISINRRNQDQIEDNQQHQSQFESVAKHFFQSVSINEAKSFKDILNEQIYQESSALCFEEEGLRQLKEMTKNMSYESLQRDLPFLNYKAIYIEADSSKNWMGIYRNKKFIRCPLNEQNEKIVRYCQGISIELRQVPQKLVEEQKNKNEKPPPEPINEQQSTNKIVLKNQTNPNPQSLSIEDINPTLSNPLHNLQQKQKNKNLQPFKEVIPSLKKNQIQHQIYSKPQLYPKIQSQFYKPKNLSPSQKQGYKHDKNAPSIDKSSLYGLFQPVNLDDSVSKKHAQEIFLKQQKIQKKESDNNKKQKLESSSTRRIDQKYSSHQNFLKYPPAPETLPQKNQNTRQPQNGLNYSKRPTDFRTVQQSHIKSNIEQEQIETYNHDNSQLRKLNGKQPQSNIRKSQTPINNHQGNRGLKNIGNTCYMNSVLQCLDKSKPFNQLFKAFVQQYEYQKKQLPSLSAQYNKLLDQLSKKQQYPYNPEQIKNIVAQTNVLFQGYGQNNAVQFLSTFLEQLGQQLNISGKNKLTIQLNQKQSDQELYRLQKQKDQSKNYSPVENCFVGMYRTIYTCQMCLGKYRLFQKFKVHYVPIPKPEQTDSYQLTQCLRDFEKQDLMTGDNAFPCDYCLKDTTTKKGMAIYKSNTILVIGLKRFHDNVKNQRIIDIPMKLNSKQFQYKNVGKLSKNRVYKLYAALIHRGSIHGGHYTAVCSDFSSSNSNQWKLYNDTYVSDIDESKLKRELQEAYALFYELISE